MTHRSRTRMPIWKATSLQLLLLTVLSHLKALRKQTKLPIRVICFYCSKWSWQKSGCQVYFLTTCVIRKLFKVLIPPLCICLSCVLSYDQISERSCFNFHTPITWFTSTDVSVFSGDRTQSNLAGCIQHKLHWYWRTRSSLEYNQHYLVF